MRLFIGLSKAKRPTKHIIDHIGDGNFSDPTGTVVIVRKKEIVQMKDFLKDHHINVAIFNGLLSH